MAIDTHAKRLTVLNLGAAPLRLLPEPSGTVEGSDRFTRLGLYGGFATSLTWGLSGGSFLVTGQTAALPARRFSTPQTGTYAVTGQTAVWQVQRTLSATGGQFVITGELGALALQLRSGLDFGAYQVTGGAMTMAGSGEPSHTTWALGTGQFFVTGGPVTTALHPASPSLPDTIGFSSGVSHSPSLRRAPVHLRIGLSGGRWHVTGQPLIWQVRAIPVLPVVTLPLDLPVPEAPLTTRIALPQRVPVHLRYALAGGRWQWQGGDAALVVHQRVHAEAVGSEAVVNPVRPVAETVTSPWFRTEMEDLALLWDSLEGEELSSQEAEDLALLEVG